MTKAQPTKSTYSEEEIAQRRDEVIKRMLSTPPRPHKNKPKRRKSNKPEAS